MELLSLPVKLILAFVLGAVVGLEREINEKKGFVKGENTKASAILGLRSFSLIAGLGAICGLLYDKFLIFSVVVAIAFVCLFIIYYFLNSKFTTDIGITTELAIIITFAIGFIIAVDLFPIQLTAALTIILVLLMSRKKNIKGFVEDISGAEINAVVSFAILAFVILPFLPNETDSLSNFGGVDEFLKKTGINTESIADLELFNPFKLWLIVVLITGVELLGYILERTLGRKKGWLVTSMVGGFVSSTATTLSIAQKSRNNKNTDVLLSGAVLANFVSFIPIAFLLITLNPGLFFAFLPILAVISITALVIGLYFLYFKKSSKMQADEDKESQKRHIFDLNSALRFMGLFLVINIASKLSLEFFGNSGFLTTTALGSLAGVDAVVINTAQLAGGRIDLALAVWALVIINVVNLMAKSVYSYVQGSREFAFKFFICMFLIVISGILAAFIF